MDAGPRAAQDHGRGRRVIIRGFGVQSMDASLVSRRSLCVALVRWRLLVRRVRRRQHPQEPADAGGRAGHQPGRSGDRRRRSPARSRSRARRRPTQPINMASDPYCMKQGAATTPTFVVGERRRSQNVFVYVKDGLGNLQVPGAGHRRSCSIRRAARTARTSSASRSARRSTSSTATRRCTTSTRCRRPTASSTAGSRSRG